MNLKTYTLGMTLACSLALLAGCGSSTAASVTNDAVPSAASSLTTSALNAVPTSTAAASTAAATAAATTTTTTTTATSAARLTPAEIETLLFVREEEKLARDVYLTLYNQWNLKVFQNIAQRSEQQHLDVMGKLVQTYNLVDPVVSDAIGAFTNPQLLALYQDLTMKGKFSNSEALKVGGFIEEFDIQDLQDAINEARAASNPQDIITAYTNLMCGSRNHLRGFAQQYKQTTGTAYTAQVIPQATVDAIISTPEELCGQ